MTVSRCLGCGRKRDDEISLLCNGCITIVFNIRTKYGTKLAYLDDITIAERFDDWNASEKMIPELEWILTVEH